MPCYPSNGLLLLLFCHTVWQCCRTPAMQYSFQELTVSMCAIHLFETWSINLNFEPTRLEHRGKVHDSKLQQLTMCTHTHTRTHTHMHTHTHPRTYIDTRTPCFRHVACVNAGEQDTTPNHFSITTATHCHGGLIALH